MIRASEETEYQVPDERSRVTCLLESIQTSYPKLESAKVTVENDIQKREDFEKAADFLCRFAPKKKDNPGGLYRIASAATEMKSELDDLEHVDVEVRYYKPDEWNRLSKDQKKKCVLTRQIQMKEGGTLSGNKRKPIHHDKASALNNKWKRKIKKQNRIIAALKANSGVNTDKDNTNTIDTDRKFNKKVKFNVGVTQRKVLVKNDYKLLKSQLVAAVMRILFI